VSNHTAGPWKLFNGWGADSRRPVIVDSVPDVGGKFVGNCICHMASTNPDMDANARLIAAAPELLEFAKQVVAYANDSNNTYLSAWAQSVVNTAEGVE